MLYDHSTATYIALRALKKRLKCLKIILNMNGAVFLSFNLKRAVPNALKMTQIFEKIKEIRLQSKLPVHTPRQIQ